MASWACLYTPKKVHRAFFKRSENKTLNRKPRGKLFRFYNLGFSSFFPPGASYFSFWTSDSDSACRNPPQGHLLRSGNLNFRTTYFFIFLNFYNLGFSSFFASGASLPSFWTSNSDSPCRNPPQGHLLRSGNRDFDRNRQKWGEKKYSRKE